jgi:hypothetical protein
MAELLAARYASGKPVSEVTRRQAQEALEALGLPQLLDRIAIAERIIRTGEGFHSVARFFVDGSEEQTFILGLQDRSE